MIEKPETMEEERGRLAAEVARLKEGMNALEAEATGIASDAVARETAARSEEREACAKIADDEEEPAAGKMPPQIIRAVLEQDTVFIERALIAAVRATKKNIAAAIRARGAGFPAADEFERWVKEKHRTGQER